MNCVIDQQSPVGFAWVARDPGGDIPLDTIDRDHTVNSLRYTRVRQPYHKLGSIILQRMSIRLIEPDIIGEVVTTWCQPSGDRGHGIAVTIGPHGIGETLTGVAGAGVLVILPPR